MTDKLKTVYVTKFLFSCGIMKKRAFIGADGESINIRGFNRIHKPYWYYNEHEAIEHAKKLIENKIISTEKNLVKLRAFDFTVK